MYNYPIGPGFLNIMWNCFVEKLDSMSPLDDNIDELEAFYDDYHEYFERRQEDDQ